MPSRILKESICTSESLAYLSAEAEVLFYLDQDNTIRSEVIE